MKKKFTVLILLVVLISLFALPCSAALYSTDHTYYVEVQTTQLGRITLLIPSNYANFFQFGGEIPLINSNSSTYSVFIKENTNVYNNQVRFAPFDVPEYRTTSTSYDYQQLTITQVYDSNLPGYVYKTPFVNDSNLYMLLIAGVTFLGLIFTITLIRRR